jgi:hypothetical protein
MKVHHWLAGVVSCVLPCLPALCHAESAPHIHDGFYLQMSLGAGFLGTSGSQDGFAQTISGGAVTGSLWIGGSIIPGLAVGGGTLGAIAPRPHIKLTNNGQSEPQLGPAKNAAQLQMLGLVGDFYPNPAKGLHFQALLGYAVLSFGADDDRDNGTTSASGPALMAGVGYDLWVSDEWSIGVLGRFSYAATTYSFFGLPDESFPVISPSLVASFTYN